MSAEITERPATSPAERTTSCNGARSRSSCVYVGTVRHRRDRPAAHAFSFPLFLPLIDLEEVDRFFRIPLLCSTSPISAVRFRRADYYGDPTRSLADCVRELVQHRTGISSTGPIRLLTNLRYFGFVFNPVSFYFCYDTDGETLQAVVADVTNTPWGEKHEYVIPCDPDANTHTHECDKEFHVSPFMQMAMQYRWRMTSPGSRLDVQIRNHDAADCIFEASLELKRQELTYARLCGLLVRFPFITLRSPLAIYWQAFRLWWKKVPFVPHPKQRTLESFSETSHQVTRIFRTTNGNGSGR
jgi:DUF1365 family protein